MNKNVIIGTTIIMIALCASLLSAANAQTYTSGVSVGDVFKYQYSFSSNINGSKQFVVPTFFDTLTTQAKTIDWIQMTITNVTGSTVEVQMVTQYKSGTQQTYNGTINVATGEGELAQFLIAANLGLNSPLSMGSDEKINSTTTKTYSSCYREVNIENITSEYNVPQEELGKYFITVPLKQINSQIVTWDKQSGALVTMTYHMTTKSTEVYADISLTLNIIESNVFTVPEYPVVIIVLAVLIIPTIAAIKIRKISKK